MVESAREVDDINVFNRRHVTVLGLLEEERDVLRRGLEVVGQLRRRHEVLAVRVVACDWLTFLMNRMLQKLER